MDIDADATLRAGTSSVGGSSGKRMRTVHGIAKLDHGGPWFCWGSAAALGEEVCKAWAFGGGIETT